MWDNQKFCHANIKRQIDILFLLKDANLHLLAIIRLFLGELTM